MSDGLDHASTENEDGADSLYLLQSLSISIKVLESREAATCSGPLSAC